MCCGADGYAIYPAAARPKHQDGLTAICPRDAGRQRSKPALNEARDAEGAGDILCRYPWPLLQQVSPRRWIIVIIHEGLLRIASDES